MVKKEKMSSDEKSKLRVMLVLDVIGKPAKHLIESLNRVIEEIDKEKGIEVKSKEIKEPTSLKQNHELYTTFAEVEIEAEDFMYFIIVLFKYMPAHIEIIEPELIGLTNNNWNDILNEIARRLHGYDEIARMMQNENNLLQNRIIELTGERMVTPLTRKSDLNEKQRKALEKSRKKAKPKGKSKREKN